MIFLLRDMLPSGTMLEQGKYRIDYPLGRGGFGITYRAFHVETQMPVVIKEFFPLEQAMRDGTSGHVTVPTTEHGTYGKALDSFLREAKILFKLRHDNVVRVYDYFRSKNTAYIVMELLEGCTLRDALDNQPQRKMPTRDVEEIVEQMVGALDAIHRYGVLHLDISPDNVLMTHESKVVLIDFGAARQSLNTTDSFMSSSNQQYKMDYAAPEILAASDLGPQSDLFELAMMVHELLLGERPPSVLQRIATGDKWKPSGLDENWCVALSEALYIEQNMRPSTVREWWNAYKGMHTQKKKMVIGQKTEKGKRGIIIKRPSSHNDIKGSFRKT